MNSKEMAKELFDLAQLDVDAMHAYSTAISSIDVPMVRETMIRFREDHERHVNQLSVTIRNFGGTPPSLSPDFKGFMIQGMTAVRSATGTEGALMAMKTNEALTNRTYARALKLGFPADVLELLQRNFVDEQRHLHTIERWIETEIWESSAAHP